MQHWTLESQLWDCGKLFAQVYFCVFIIETFRQKKYINRIRLIGEKTNNF